MQDMLKLKNMEKELLASKEALNASKSYFQELLLISIEMGSVPSEIKWSYPAKEMGAFSEQFQGEEFRKAPYWKYCNVLQIGDIQRIPLYDTKLCVHGK